MTVKRLLLTLIPFRDLRWRKEIQAEHDHTFWPIQTIYRVLSFQMYQLEVAEDWMKARTARCPP
jgi:hypothetical protein